MNLIIRELRADDLKGCSDLYSQVFSGPPWSENWNEEKAYKRLSHFQKSEGFVGLIAEDEEVKAFVLGNAEPFLDGYWFYLREMCVSAKSQRKGVGTKLLNKLNETLSAHRVKNIYLATDRNIPAANFYTKNGYKQEAKMGFYYKSV